LACTDTGSIRSMGVKYLSTVMGTRMVSRSSSLWPKVSTRSRKFRRRPRQSLGWRRFGWYVWDQGPGLPGDWNGRLVPVRYR
jgi:hypothetical protein